MKHIALSAIVPAVMLLPAFSGFCAAADLQADVFQTSQGPLRVTPIFHASVMLEFDGKVMYVDPSRGDFTGLPPADLIFITHTHGDHLDKAVMEKLKKPSTLYVGTSAVIDTVNCHCKQINVVNEGQSKTIIGIGVEAIPMYNAPEAGVEPAHHRGIGSGFVLTFGGTRVYLSGDTDCTAEVKALKSIDVAFVLGLKNAAETAQCVKEFKPKVFYPYHYNGQNPQEIADALKGTPGIEVRVRKLENQR